MMTFLICFFYLLLVNVFCVFSIYFFFTPDDDSDLKKLCVFMASVPISFDLILIILLGVFYYA